VTSAWDNEDNGAESGCVETIVVACVSVIWSFWDLSVRQRHTEWLLIGGDACEVRRERFGHDCVCVLVMVINR
jgi:hypothetical protein